MVTDHCGSSNKNTAASLSTSFIGFFGFVYVVCLFHFCAASIFFLRDERLLSCLENAFLVQFFNFNFCYV